MKAVIAALQIEPKVGDTRATLNHILSFESEIKESGASLVLLPEATLGGYPKGSNFGTYVGYRLEHGRKEFAEYYNQSVTIPGEEITELEGLSSRTGATIAIGVIERDYHTLYCTLVYIDPAKGYVAKHRKLMPTASERLIWGQGDGSTLPVVETKAGRIGGAICWENHMPLLRAAMYAKTLDIWVAPTVDDRDIWQTFMKSIAYEGRLFLVTAVPYRPCSPISEQMPGWPEGKNVINGGSMIIGPMGDVLAGPLIGKEGLVCAEIDTEKLTEARYDFDVNGHYSRPDVFSLNVDERPKNHVVNIN